MKRLFRFFSWILLSFMFCGLLIGYAAVADTLTVSGAVNYKEKPFEGIYISDVSVYSQNGASSLDADVIKPTNLQTVVNATSRNATVTYEITVYNNTDITYWYLGVEAFEQYGSNSLLGTANGVFVTTKDTSAQNSAAFDSSDWVPPKTTRVFYATYTYGSSAQGEISLLLNFNFGIHIDAVHDGFLAVLNDKTSSLGYYYLSGLFDDKYQESGRTVIGNVGDDAKDIKNLFGSNLTINIDGQEKPVTLMIERRNVDGNASSGDKYSTGSLAGCEYTVYITVDNLSSPGSKATVYAVSYTCDANGVWRQIGELYEGTSTVKDYENGDETYDGAFDVSSWRATQKDYSVTANISYKVGYPQGTEYDKLNTIDQLMSTKDQEFYNKVNNNSQALLKPVCQILYSYRHNGGSYIESVNTANAEKGGFYALKAAFDKIKPYCLIANGAQEVKIQNASSLTRADLICLLEEIQNAYDYYLEVNPS